MSQRMEAFAHKAADAQARNDWQASQRLYDQAMRLGLLLRNQSHAKIAAYNPKR
jgi:maltooligosyltrehalose synthase